MASRCTIIASFVSLFSAAFAGQQTNKTDPITELRSMRLTARHIENKGVGYNTGYSTLELFLAPSPDRWSVMPFLDVRGHVFDDGKFATNAGIGFRGIAGCRVYGMNAYWDYRNTNRAHYNQVGVGFETLGTRWDFRLNGYLPVAAKTSHPYHVHNTSSVTFETFSGNNALIRSNTSQSSQVQFAMKGLDAEASYHILKTKNFDVYPAIGPYFYQYKNKHAIGGRVRVGAQIYQYLTLEVIDTYDNLFHNNVQGRVGLTLPFGPRPKAQNSRFSKCDDGYYVCERMLQDVYRQEMIVVDKRHKKEAHSDVSVAINPATGLPYIFYFVDNTSSSAGTYESPFSSLLTAQMAASPGDNIYVFPGDNTTTNMDQGIILQANQSLLGASIAYPLPTTLGSVTIPPLATNMPVITNFSGPVVTLGGDNTYVSGFTIENQSGTGIQGIQINNVNVQNNKIIGGNGNDGINLQNISSLVTINNNVFAQTSFSNYATRLVQTNASCNVTFSNNTVFGKGQNATGFSTELSNNSSIGTLSITGNTFLGNANNSVPAINVSMVGTSAIQLLDVKNNHSSLYYYGLNVSLNDTATLFHATTTNNNFGNYRDGYTGISFDLEGSSTVGTITIADSILSGTSTYGATIFSNSSGPIGEITVSNTELNTGSYGLALEFDGLGSVGNILISNCAMNAHTSTGTYLTLGGSGSVGNYTVENSTFTGNTGGPAIGFNLSNAGSIGNISISNSNLDHNPSSGFVVGSIFTGSGSVGNMEIDHCSIQYNDSTYAILAYFPSGTGVMENLAISNCQLDYSVNGGGIQVDGTGPATLHNLIVTDTTITNSQNDFYINLVNSSMDSIVVSNVNASNSVGFSFDANLTNSSIGTLAIDHFTAEGSTNGIVIAADNTSTINTVSLSNLTMSSTPNQHVRVIKGLYDNFSITNSTFVNANSAAIFMDPEDPISSLSITDCSFQFNNASITTVTAINALIANNSFQNTVSQNLNLPHFGAFSSTYKINNNTFSGTTTPVLGYGAHISVNSGDLCLDFQNNVTIPPVDQAVITPYLFQQFGGTFNLTAESTQANNTGVISTTGTVGAPGSCSQ